MPFTTRAAAALLLVTPLAACNGAPPDPPAGANAPSTPPATPAPVPTPRSTAAADAGAAPRSATRQCRFEVDGKRLVDGPCQVFPMGDGGYTLNTWSAGKPAHSHFAVVSVRGDGKADASWNADPDDDKAMDPLGIVALQDGCWVNPRTRICAR
ncbi:hypothetical protein [uncultured Sphingomonas sp.]|uniref:hypothetical protein n=1 Tax=uncultured Sphingomonas sp. TaxID=158754 RepID=UPI0025EC0197|nr:hypothetical protein [uncultured Sphingomonas sp.]